MKYDFAQIEQRQQAYWAAQNCYKTPNPGDHPEPDRDGFDSERPKFYVLDFFPYPSGVGLHVGHPLGYIATDILARYKRMRGFNVLHPMGFDAFGLPAEQFAVEHGVHPRVTTRQNIANMIRQFKRLGMSYDWDRCFATTDPEYYKWTQWIFLQMYHAWYDPTAGSAGKARPIAELVHELEAGNLYVGPDGELVPAVTAGFEPIEGDPIGARKWRELPASDQRELLDNQRLAYMAEVPVNWCPALGTVLANEEVTNNGRSERGNHPVFKRPLRQWMLRITAYAQRLIDDLDRIDWPEPIKLMQRNWIGRSEGALVYFPLAASEGDGEHVISVFTTRPDTLFGATYMVLAPEHPLVDAITTGPKRRTVEEYQRFSASRSDLDRQVETRGKTGVATGAYAINPTNNHKLPIWISDYVMMGYGTGAIMAVPAHDQRDHDFARAFDLTITQVVSPGDARIDIRDQAWTGEGIGMNSENTEVSLNGLPTGEAKKTITEWLESRGFGRRLVHYKLRDWLFSRQRYWGEPFPILHAPDGQIVAIDESELPVELPPMEDFTPHVGENGGDRSTGEVQTPLSRAPDSWKYVQRDGQRYRRELNTMPQWAGSCWYYVRYLDPRNQDRFVDPRVERYWMAPQQEAGIGDRPGGGRAADCAAEHRPPSGGVDLYVGGAEHAVLHLLYARFWHKVLFDLGHVSTPEPFARLFNQGYIQAPAYTDSRGLYVPSVEVEEKADGSYVYRGKPVRQEFGKMGKSLKNAVTPDEICDRYGCDTLRLYEMYMGPLDQSKLWQPRDIIGVHRFLQRLWRNFVDEDSGELLVYDAPPPDDLRRKLHRTIKRVSDSMESLSFNVAIAALIELNNDLVRRERLPREVAENLVLCLAPMAPHVAEELWQRLHHSDSPASVCVAAWPECDESLLVEEEIEYPVQVNGKLRDRITVPAESDDDAVEAAARRASKVAAAIEGKTVLKVIVIRGRLVNLVAR